MACGDDASGDPDENGVCPENTYRAEGRGPTCVELTRCQPGEYQSAAPTETSDRECAPLSPASCIPGQVLAVDVPEDGSALHDRECCYLHPGEELAPASGGWPDVSGREESCMVIAGNLRIRGSVVEPPIAIVGVRGDLTIDGLRAERVDIFSSLRTVGGELFVTHNETLKTLGDFRLLREIGGQLFVFANPALENLDGLEELQTVGGEARIEQNISLKNVDGLRSLESVAERLGFSGNPALINLDGLARLTHVGISLDLYENDALTNVDGLSGLKTLTGPLVDGIYYSALYLDKNQSLASLAGLSNIETLTGDLTAMSLASLPDLSDLSSLTSITGTLRVKDNPLICDSEAIALGTRASATDLDIENNGAENPDCD